MIQLDLYAQDTLTSDPDEGLEEDEAPTTAVVRNPQEGTREPALDPRHSARRSTQTSWNGFGRYEVHFDRKLERMLLLRLKDVWRATVEG